MGKSPADNRLTLVTVVRKLASMSSLALAIYGEEQNFELIHEIIFEEYVVA